ncbi:MAG: tetratricopeptide repeat protein [Spirochaetaceae bacterium]|jgi:tetratricopeptide (TPR) repeat protein|nr:tetratricopeptide repeat protein [Spirochaetaceae bacterium]
MEFKTRRTIIFIALVLFPLYIAQAQSRQQTPETNNNLLSAQIDRGIEFYGNGRWGEAIVQLRRAQQENIGTQARAEAQFWIAMSEFAAGQYQDAVHDFDEISRIDPVNIRCVEVPYQKGRAYYYLKRYDEAIRLLNAYADSIRIDGRYLNGRRISGWSEGAFYNNIEGDYNRKSAAIYWMGECFYSMDDMTRAEELFNIVVKEYPKSHKFEPSTNRLALIKQKKIEVELLNILKSTPAESNQAATTPQQQSDEDAIREYQKRIAPYLIPDTQPPVVEKPAEKNTDTIIRLLSIKTTALEILERLLTVLNSYDLIEDESW